MLETTWDVGTGWLRVSDALLVAPTGDTPHAHDRKRPLRDREAAHVLLRYVECLHGTAEVTYDCELRFEYGLVAARWERDENGAGGLIAVNPNDGDRLRLVSDAHLQPGSRHAVGSRRLRSGEASFAALSWSDGSPPTSGAEAAQALLETLTFWREWLSAGSFPDHRWKPFLQTSALVLKGLTYTPSGAVLAAPTMSLPEALGADRNWDYRYVWIRDASYVLWGLRTLGSNLEASAFFDFVADICEDDELRVMYGVNGERELDEETLPHLTGYEGSQPVRRGNAAYLQRQHDVWGVAVDALYMQTKFGHGAPFGVWPAFKRQVDYAIANWQLPDEGIWEIRSAPRHYTSSKVMSWVAVDRGARLAQHFGLRELEQQWRVQAAQMKDEICERSVRDGIFRQHYETDALDASTLLIPLMRFLPYDDERVVRTVRAVQEGLMDGGLVLRYKLEDAPDGFSAREATFTICSFWLVSALEEIGFHEPALELCARLVGLAGPLGLYAEELDAATGRHLGNYPQALTHLALINAVSKVIAVEEGRSPRRFPPTE